MPVHFGNVISINWVEMQNRYLPGVALALPCLLTFIANKSDSALA